MKRLLLILCWMVSCMAAIKAQNQPLFIFEQFANAKVYFKNHSVTIVTMNYDAVNDKMYFKDQDDLMELTNAVQIDSIVWAGKRKFIPHEKGFLEQIKLENGIAFVHWRIKNVNVGAAGAMGTVTQAKVEAVNIRSMGVFSAESKRINSADVFKLKNDNDYYITVAGKQKKISSMKHVLKAFPAHEGNIKEYADKENIKMEDPAAVLQLLDYCLSLK